MKIDIVTLFPDVFTPLGESIVKRAQEKNLVEINIHDLRKWSTDKHNTVDDKPYGGGAGMVLMVEPIYKAISKLKTLKSKIILLSPQGKLYDQSKAKTLSKETHLILIAGHYEGFDERIREHLVDEEISIGEYVLTGGELPAMVIVDSVVRLIPGVLGDENSLVGETHSKKGYKKHPVYTRPEKFMGWKVPEVLLSGNHLEIEKWKKENVKN
ncbi:tRNA (guanosine(37)-N1)-methyltransferase TrmD [Patescibacteria group bacterium]